MALRRYWLYWKRKIHYIKVRLFGSQIEKLRKAGAIIGENVHIFNTYIDTRVPFLVEIGDNVTLTDAKILAHDASTKQALDYTKIGKVQIGNDVFIGAKAVVLPNVKIGNRCIIGAGSVVTKDIPDNSVVAGNPCRVIMSYDEYIKKEEAAISNDNCIDKDPEKLTKEEINYIRTHIDGIWYIK